jgi:hypothetical protein
VYRRHVDKDADVPEVDEPLYALIELAVQAGCLKASDIVGMMACMPLRSNIRRRLDTLRIICVARERASDMLLAAGN